MKDTTEHGTPIVVIKEILDVAPDDLIEKIFALTQAHFDGVAYGLGCLIMDYLPKGTFVIWDEPGQTYISYVREADGKDPDLDGAPFIGLGRTRAEALQQGAAKYLAAVKDNAKT